VPDLRVLRLKDLEQLTFCLLYLCDAAKMRPAFQAIQHAMTRYTCFFSFFLLLHSVLET
jgi:hypothetical protein